MASGQVKWFNPTKGYGFIQPSDGGKDVFVHISAVERAGLSSLNEGQRVEYELVTNRGKTSAENPKVRRSTPRIGFECAGESPRILFFDPRCHERAVHHNLRRLGCLPGKAGSVPRGRTPRRTGEGREQQPKRLA